jgi:hypothetical protein
MLLDGAQETERIQTPCRETAQPVALILLTSLQAESNSREVDVAGGMAPTLSLCFRSVASIIYHLS